MTITPEMKDAADRAQRIVNNDMENIRCGAGWLFYLFFISVTIACAKRTGAAASVECRQREPARAISPQ